MFGNSRDGMIVTVVLKTCSPCLWQVPAAVAHSEFWQRYFYKVFQLEQVWSPACYAEHFT